MKLIIVLSSVLAVAMSAKLGGLQGPRGPVAHISVLRDDSIAPVGANYRTSFQTENGINVEEEGATGSVGQTIVRGTYSYTSPEGEVITINYVADENGYRAEGPHIHPMPAHSVQQLHAAAEAIRAL